MNDPETEPSKTSWASRPEGYLFSSFIMLLYELFSKALQDEQNGYSFQKDSVHLQQLLDIQEYYRLSFVRLHF